MHVLARVMLCQRFMLMTRCLSVHLPQATVILKPLNHHRATVSAYGA